MPRIRGIEDQKTIDGRRWTYKNSIRSKNRAHAYARGFSGSFYYRVIPRKSRKGIMHDIYIRPKTGYVVRGRKK